MDEQLQPLWYKDAIIYQVRVRSFMDSNDDGIGDFRGLTSRLDYIQELGVTALWLLPFYPSPLRDDGYDTADYTQVHPECGSLQDFKLFLREAHRRGLKVITELVLNHTSDQHHWFQRARRAKPGSRWRDWYVWSDSPERYREARIIFKDFEPSNWTWDSQAQAYYWHRFYSHQPDLNYDNPQVRKAVLQALDFWFNLGVDGYRLDAVPYLYEREGTGCENLPETHAFLRELRSHLDARFSNRMLLAEANQWPEDAVAYFGKGDECHMAFHFPVMPRLFMALRTEDRYPIIDILEQTPQIPDSCQWAVFLRNHDELTLEMVTDEERDYMYRVYAQDPAARINLGIRRRLAPLLGNDRRRVELMNGLLFSLPGTPILYYGDEIGMGDNVYLGDRNGVRTPMQWSGDRNAGFSRANPQKLYLPVVVDPEYHYQSVNVEAQEHNPHSLLWWMKRLIALRKRHVAFGRGSLEFLAPENRRVLAFLRRHQDETIMVVANLSRFSQYVELDLSQFKGWMPVELLGGTDFPLIGELPYLLTLGPHAFHWFSLQPPQPIELSSGTPARAPQLKLRRGWRELLKGAGKGRLEQALPRFLEARRWYRSKTRRIKSASLIDQHDLAAHGADAVLVLARVEYQEGDPETYALVLGVASGDAAQRLLEDEPTAVIASLRQAEAEAELALHDVSEEPSTAAALLDLIRRRRRLKGAHGELRAVPTRWLRSRLNTSEPLPEAHALGAEQSNTSLLFGDLAVFKLYRAVESGINPELELGRWLSEKAGFRQAPPLGGWIDYASSSGDELTLGVLQGHVGNQGDAWELAQGVLARYYQQVRTEHAAQPPEAPSGPLLEAAAAVPPDAVAELLGEFLGRSELLGRRVGELHLALAAAESEALRPEPFTPFYRRALYQSMRNQAARVLQQLRRQHRRLPEPLRTPVRELIEREPELLATYRRVHEERIEALRVRIHGDLHLGQVLDTGRDFVIIDFEGEPARPLGERRLKHSALRDVAGMLRSFDYAVYVSLRHEQQIGVVPDSELERLLGWGQLWARWVGASFLRAYQESIDDSALLPAEPRPRSILLDAFLLHKAIYELGYELDNRPDWVEIPLRGVLEVLNRTAES